MTSNEAVMLANIRAALCSVGVLVAECERTRQLQCAVRLVEGREAILQGLELFKSETLQTSLDLPCKR